jgi:hypothetical protein
VARAATQLTIQHKLLSSSMDSSGLNNNGCGAGQRLCHMTVRVQGYCSTRVPGSTLADRAQLLDHLGCHWSLDQLLLR